MCRIRHSVLIASLCGLLLVSPADAQSDPWLTSQFDPESSGAFGIRAEDTEYSIEDLGTLGSPFASQFPDLPIADNPFYPGVETDRAAFTPALSSAAFGTVILEAGYSFIANRHLPSQQSVPELVMRYGVTDRIEARFGWNEELGGGGSIVSAGQQQEGLVDPRATRPLLSYVNRFMGGVKVRLFDQKGLLPANTVLFEGYFPSFGDTRKKQIAATYVLGWEFFPRWQLNASLRYATESELRDDWALWCPSIVLRVPFAERWTGQVEAFAILPQGQGEGVPQYYAGPGMQVLLTPNIQLNLRVGAGLNSASPEIYTTAGFGVAF